jgi:mono/diheme cytochrome c family protein
MEVHTMKMIPTCTLALLAVWAAPVGADEPVTFAKHVAPILWKHCAECHHPGAVAPFPLLSYKDAAKRARFLRDVTALRRMPPWRAEPGYGPFANERRLSDSEIQTLAKWAAGAPEGDVKDLPKPPTFPQGWTLGEPDLLLQMPSSFTVPPSGPDVYRCFVLPLPVGGEQAVAAVEFHPGNRRVIHHASFFLDDKGRGRQKQKETNDGQPGYPSFGGPGFAAAGSLGGWSLAALPTRLPEGTAMLLPSGCDLVLQIHYHPDGKEETDRSELGIYFSKKPPPKFHEILCRAWGPVSPHWYILGTQNCANRVKREAEVFPSPLVVFVLVLKRLFHITVYKAVEDRMREGGAMTLDSPRERLRGAAGEIFAEKGFKGTTVRAIIDRAGVNIFGCLGRMGGGRQRGVGGFLPSCSSRVRNLQVSVASCCCKRVMISSR